jgi:hypothetical protein
MNLKLVIREAGNNVLMNDMHDTTPSLAGCAA